MALSNLNAAQLDELNKNMDVFDETKSNDKLKTSKTMVAGFDETKSIDDIMDSEKHSSESNPHRSILAKLKDWSVDKWRTFLINSFCFWACFYVWFSIPGLSI